MMAPSIRHDATSFSEDKALMTGLASKARGPVDQLEDRYLGMVEAVGSNPTRSIPVTVQNVYPLGGGYRFSCPDEAKAGGTNCLRILTSRGGMTTSPGARMRLRTTITESSVGSSQRTV